MTKLIGKLSHNELTGFLPSSFDNLQKLQRLSLSHVQYKENGTAITGFSSKLLRQCHVPTRDLSNALSSNIPTSSWKLKDLFVLNLSSNSLHGFVPPAIGNLKGTAVLDLYNIPDSIGDLQNLFNLSLAHNQLTGPIPESVGNALPLELLDLSHNNLSGLIPREISKMTMNFKKSLQRGRFEYRISSKGRELAFAECEYWNVSFNGLSGEVPSNGPFTNFTGDSMRHFVVHKGWIFHHVIQLQITSQVEEKYSNLYSSSWGLPQQLLP
ncbi:unnamed protein product [Coffea canephora]|uniref:Uncharacterized protein n=1 Tax=Coffea canephora TaxID=49390 RepID=A0A068TN75_COFCA|nr:unnamed protein product [Coffea canephora]